MMITERAAGRGAAHDVAVRGYELESSFRDEALAQFDMLYRIAVQLTSDRPSAKRLLQKAILTAFRSWEDRPDELEPRVWVAQVLVQEHRRLFDVDEILEEERAGTWARAATFLNEAFIDEHARAALMRNLTPAVVRRAISHLPLSARRVLALSDISGFSYSELASVLNSTVHEVRNRLYAARELLKWYCHHDVAGVKPRQGIRRICSGSNRVDPVGALRSNSVSASRRSQSSETAVWLPARPWQRPGLGGTLRRGDPDAAPLNKQKQLRPDLA